VRCGVWYIPTTLNFADVKTKTLVPKKHKEEVEIIISAKDAYRIDTARREMTDEKYDSSYVIMDLGDSDGPSRG
jgi:hypothetical protein